MDCERLTWLRSWILIRPNPYFVSRMVRVAWVFLAFIVYIICTDPMEFNCLAHFSENWGYIILSPMISLNILSFLFGRILDAHAGKALEDLFTITTLFTYEPPRCLEGRDCYVDAIYLTICISLLSFFLSLWAGYRDSCKATNSGGKWSGQYFLGGYDSMKLLRILFESRLDFVCHFQLR